MLHRGLGPIRIPLAALACLLTLSLVPATADAAVVGVNAKLNQIGNKLFIPLKPATSGALQDGRGVNADAVMLSTNQTTTGYVTFDLAYNLLPDFAGQDLDANGANLLFTLLDLDVDGKNHRESMELTFLRDAGDPASAVATLVLDAASFALYQQAPREYAFHLRDDFGLTPADFDNINADKEFGVSVRLVSSTTYKGPGSILLTNTAETFDTGRLVVFGVPEPATMLLLGCGLPVLVLRLRRK